MWFYSCAFYLSAAYFIKGTAWHQSSRSFWNWMCLLCIAAYLCADYIQLVHLELYKWCNPVETLHSLHRWTNLETAEARRQVTWPKLCQQQPYYIRQWLGLGLSSGLMHCSLAWGCSVQRSLTAFYGTWCVSACMSHTTHSPVCETSAHYQSHVIKRDCLQSVWTCG